MLRSFGASPTESCNLLSLLPVGVWDDLGLGDRLRLWRRSGRGGGSQRRGLWARPPPALEHQVESEHNHYDQGAVEKGLDWFLVVNTAVLLFACTTQFLPTRAVTYYARFLLLGPTVADDSSVGNYSRQHEARFFHELAQAMPGLLDYVIAADRARRLALSAVICDVLAFDGHRRAAGARPIASLLIMPVDVPSVLHYSLTSSNHDMNSLRVVIDGMVDASPRVRAQVEAMRARTRLAVRVQRAWRRRQGWSGVISA